LHPLDVSPKEKLMNPIRNEHGAALILGMLLIALLGLVGLWTSRGSILETRIAVNDRLRKVSFYAADGATETGIEVLEQNIEQRGFPVAQDGAGNDICTVGNVAVDLVNSSAQFYANGDIGNAKPSCTNRDLYLPRSNAGCTPPITNIRIGGSTTLSTGGAIQMLAGYEGKGKGAAGGGAWITYDVRAQHMGSNNSEAVVNVRWRHVM